MIKIADLKKVDDNTYLCTSCYVMSIKRDSESKFIYSDMARVKVNFYVPYDGSENVEDFLIKLGDMSVVENP